MNILVTGAAGFIGYHLCKKLIKNGISVVGVDDFNSYYDPNLKYNRKENLLSVAQKLNVKFEIIDSKIEDESSMRYIFQKSNLKLWLI